MKIKTTIDTMQKIQDFNSFAQKCADDVCIYQDKWIINGKSLLGLYSLDLCVPVEVEFNGDIDGNFINDLGSKNFSISIV